MQIAQRVLLVLVVIVLLMVGAKMTVRDREEKMRTQWESVQTERFLKQICRRESLSWNEYMYFFETLNRSGSKLNIRIDIYRTEQDLAGEVYYFLRSWEELQEYYYEESTWYLETGSIIRVEIGWQTEDKSGKNVYYGRITGKE